MGVARAELDVVLDRKGGNPKIVGRDGRATLAQLQKYPGVVLSCCIVGQEHTHPIAGQKLPESSEVLRFAVAGGKSSPQFANHDQGEENSRRPSHHLDPARFAPQKIAVGVCVERDVHLLPNFGINLLKRANRRIEGGIVLPCADQGIQIVMLDRGGGLSAPAVLGQPRSESHDFLVGKAFDGLFNFTNGAHARKNARITAGFKRQFLSARDGGSHNDTVGACPRRPAATKLNAFGF